MGLFQTPTKNEKMKNLINIILALSILLFASCNKNKEDEEEPQNLVSTASAKVMFEHFFDNDLTPFNLNTKYITANDDTVSMTKLAYFVSNVKLTRDNGDVYTESESYHLVQKEDGQMMVY